MGASRRARRKLERSMMKEATRTYRAELRRQHDEAAEAEVAWHNDEFTELRPVIDEENSASPANDVVDIPIEPSARELAHKVFNGE